MNKQDLIEYCLSFPNTYWDTPFPPSKDGSIWTLIRIRGNKKAFAWIYERNDKLCINIKTDLDKVIFLREVYSDLIPGYHMNKLHWSTIMLGGDVPVSETKQLIGESYNLCT